MNWQPHRDPNAPRERDPDADYRHALELMLTDQSKRAWAISDAMERSERLCTWVYEWVALALLHEGPSLLPADLRAEALALMHDDIQREVDRLRDRHDDTEPLGVTQAGDLRDAAVAMTRALYGLRAPTAPEAKVFADADGNGLRARVLRKLGTST